MALAINEQAAKTPGGQNFVKKVIAEMGGKNAVIVDADADLDEAVKGVVDSAFGYGGQKCSAGSRAIVLDGIYDQFLNRLVEATKSLTVTPADDPGCSVGPVIDAEARDRILKTIETGKTEARLAHQTDVGALAEQGLLRRPDDLRGRAGDTRRIAQEEIFGPVLSVIRAKDLDDALRIANGTKYALTGGCYSRSPSHLEKVKRRFRVGNLYINRKCTGALVDRQPFGGFKLSGIGSKAGGPDYLLQFLLPRTITENQMRRGFAPETGEQGWESAQPVCLVADGTCSVWYKRGGRHHHVSDHDRHRQPRPLGSPSASAYRPHLRRHRRPPGRYYLAQSTLRKFTLDEYHKMIEQGILIDGEPYELLEGNLVKKMSRGSTSRSRAITCLTSGSSACLSAGWDVRVADAR